MPIPNDTQNDVLDKMNLLWKFVKPISFALIGKEVLFSKLDGQLIGYGVLIVIIGSLVSFAMFIPLTLIVSIPINTTQKYTQSPNILTKKGPLCSDFSKLFSLKL